MKQDQLLTKLSLKFALEQGIRLQQSSNFIETKSKEERLDLTQEYLKDVQVLTDVQIQYTDHVYRYKIKGRKSPHLIDNTLFGLYTENTVKYNILVHKCENGILKLLTYEHSKP